jgi:hypothetical protein
MELIQTLILLLVCLSVFTASRSILELFLMAQWYLYRDMEDFEPMTLGRVCAKIGELVVSFMLILGSILCNNALTGGGSG